MQKEQRERKQAGLKILLSLLLFLGLGCKTTAPVTGYGVDKGDAYFSIVVLPDTQYYTAMRHGGNMSMFTNQISWITKNRRTEKIAYVIHLGDITDHNAEEEWVRAKNEMYRLDRYQIPYGLAVGNHDQTPNSKPAAGDPNTGYSKYFGKAYFKTKSWYGGGMGATNNNDNHFDLFTANGQGFMVLYLVYNQPGHKYHNPGYEAATMQWADSVLTAHPGRKAIIVSHGTIGRPKSSNSNFVPGQGTNTKPGPLTNQGKVIYEMAKHHPNVFMMLGGHIAGEAFRRDTFQNNVIKTYLTDYQSRRNPPYAGAEDRNGGNGLMRLLRFNTSKQTVSALTFIPQKDGEVIFETDGDSQFTEPAYQ
ncbi:metallophosphoesterase [Niabella aurantiaca]|uniref:metallophosphoesterase n=1 Tax=Niabella aurantiaca TaxID=379900 RepID=UPI0003660832|nr:metallophosphoesterase [Niabella aurantiaca]